VWFTRQSARLQSTGVVPIEGARKGGRVVEGTSLENWHGRKSIVGSNPTPSATLRTGDKLVTLADARAVMIRCFETVIEGRAAAFATHSLGLPTCSPASTITTDNDYYFLLQP
jgi:hypothetical protein